MDLPSFTDQWQTERQQLFKSVHPDGRMVRYMDKEFLVYPGTFWPFADSLPLVRHFQGATHNARMHGFAGIMEVRQSDLFESLGDERFDVVTANLPFRNKPACDVVAMSQWDTDFDTNTRFFAGVGRHLRPGGRIYFAQSNFGEVEATMRLARSAGLQTAELAREAVDDTRRQEFLVYRMTLA